MFFTLNKKQNENKLSNKRLRKSIRLKGYDYAQSGLYFMTIYCHRMIDRFAKVGNGEMELNEFGEIAHDGWMRTPKKRDNVSLGTFDIMPNHMHGIICISHSNECDFGVGVFDSPLRAKKNNRIYYFFLSMGLVYLMLILWAKQAA